MIGRLIWLAGWWLGRIEMRMRHRCPICDARDCASREHAEEWMEITAW